MASLNIDVLAAVVEALCPRCTPSLHFHEIRCLNAHCLPLCQGRDDEKLRILALAALCLTSRQLSALAMPHLYHRPTCSQWPLLARTLVAHPELGRRVRHLCTRDWISPDEALLGPSAAFPPELMRNRDGEDTANGALELLLPLCPRIEELDAIRHHWETFSSLTGARPLSELTSVALTHWDTEGGFDLAKSAPLAVAAPNISALVGWQVDSCNGRAPFDNVTYLRLGQSTISADHLRSALLSCPRLESLVYSAGGSTVGYEQLTPLEMQDSLVENAPHLKSLVVDFNEAFSHDMACAAGWVLRSLAGLRELRRLEVDTRCLVPHKNPMTTRYVRGPDGSLAPVDPGPIPGVGGGALAELLPQSICDLRVRRGHYGPELASIEAALAGLGAARQFEKLKRVFLGGKGAENVEGVREAFEDVGIAFTITTMGP